MIDDVKYGTLPENASKWGVSFQINTGVKSYINIGIRKLKQVMRDAREKGDETPTMPVEPWVLKATLIEADKMISKINDDSVKLMIIEMTPKNKQSGNKL